jgi:hypothetical protein
LFTTPIARAAQITNSKAEHSGTIMKTVYYLVNFLIAILCMLVGVGNIEYVTHNPSGAAAGVGIALVVGVTCFWLAAQSVFNADPEGA